MARCNSTFSLMNLSDDGIGDQDDPPEICMYNLKKSGCLFKTKCHNLHCDKPFQWQIVRNGSDQWHKFDDKSNIAIELSYTDPNNGIWKAELPRYVI